MTTPFSSFFHQKSNFKPAKSLIIKAKSFNATQFHSQPILIYGRIYILTYF